METVSQSVKTGIILDSFLKEFVNTLLEITKEKPDLFSNVDTNYLAEYVSLGRFIFRANARSEELIEYFTELVRGFYNQVGCYPLAIVDTETNCPICRSKIGKRDIYCRKCGTKIRRLSDPV